jgi:prepilin-type processing-associated H-X9-DG protein
LPLSDRRCGVFGYERVLALEGVADGPANTMLAAETMRDNGPWTAGGTPTLRGLAPEGQPYLGESGPFASGHGERTNVAFLDGSIRPLTDSLAPHLLEALTTIAGQEDMSRLSWD